MISKWYIHLILRNKIKLFFNHHNYKKIFFFYYKYDKNIIFFFNYKELCSACFEVGLFDFIWEESLEFLLKNKIQYN
jgi:hypothetical protein